MRGLAGMVVVAAAMLAAVPVAVGGDVRRGRRATRPGAGGVNRAWRAEFGGFPPNVQPDPSAYQVIDQCPTQLFVSSAPPDGTTAPFLTSGNWVFDAPAGTRLTRLETWRFGVRLRTNGGDPDPGTDGDQGDPWRVWARDDGAQIIGGVFGENCSAPAGPSAAPSGVDSSMSAASRAVYGLNVARIAYSVSCETLPNCTRTFQNTPIATIKLFGTRVTVTDTTAPDARGRRPAARGRLAPAERPLTYDATDNTGIRAGRLDIGGRTPRDARRPATTASRRRATCSPRTIGRAARACPTASTPPASWPRTPPATRPSRTPDPGRRHAADGRARTRPRPFDRDLAHRRRVRRRGRGRSRSDGTRRSRTGRSTPRSRTVG